MEKNQSPKQHRKLSELSKRSFGKLSPSELEELSKELKRMNQLEARILAARRK